jgi:hypothetical protein
MRNLQEVTSTLIELCQAAMEQDVQILTSIRGILQRMPKAGQLP